MGKYSETTRRVKNADNRKLALQRSPLQRRALLKQGHRKRVTVTLEDETLEVREGREKMTFRIPGLCDEGGAGVLSTYDRELVVLRNAGVGNVVPVRVSLTTGEVKTLNRLDAPAELRGRPTSLAVVQPCDERAPDYLVMLASRGRHSAPFVAWAPLTPERVDSPPHLGEWHWTTADELGLYMHPLCDWEGSYGRPVIMRGREGTGEFNLAFNKQIVAVKIELLEALFTSRRAQAEAEATELAAAKAEEALREARETA